jgi:hypothetical protein
MFDSGIKKELILAFGKEKTEQIIKEIKKFKKKNPNKFFNFVFNQDGSFEAIEKKDR